MKIKWGCSASSFDLYGLPSPNVLGWGVLLFHDVKYWNNTAESTFVAIRIQIVVAIKCDSKQLRLPP